MGGKQKNIKGLVNINDRLTPLHQGKISVLDHGFLYGDSVYETFRTFSGYPFQLKQHLERLFRSAKLLQIKPNQSQKQISKALFKTIIAYWKKYGKCDLYLRIIVSRGYGDIGFDPELCPQASLIIIVKPFHPTPQATYKKGVNVSLVKTIRNNPKSLDPNIKSGNYLNNILAYLEAKKSRSFDALMENYQGNLTEGTRSNLFLIKKGVLFTPSVESGLLKGLTRTLIISTAKKARISVKEEKIKSARLFTADECFISSSLQAVLPIVTCNAKKIGSGKPGPLTKKLMGLFQQSAKEQIEEEYCVKL